MSGKYNKIEDSFGSGTFYYKQKPQMLLEDRSYNRLHNEKSMESIIMQTMHSSPHHVVHPTRSHPHAMKAFQATHGSSNLLNISGSPLLSTKSQVDPISSPRRPLSRLATPMIYPSSSHKSLNIQETSFSSQIDTEVMVAKIQNMFPTAGENHIRLLLKKYYNREAVVISALQVNKYPVTMPGPFITPPAQRHLFCNNPALQMTPPKRFGSVMSMESGGGVLEMSSRNIGGGGGDLLLHSHHHLLHNSPKPHSSPKLKLRYMKNLFPKADETLLLDVLANSENNIHTTSEKLENLGYTKEKIGAKQSQVKIAEEENKEVVVEVAPKVLTEEDKIELKQKLEQKFKSIEERIIVMALESVNYSEDRAHQILTIVQEEEESKIKEENEQIVASPSEETYSDRKDSTIEILVTQSPSSFSLKQENNIPSSSSMPSYASQTFIKRVKSNSLKNSPNSSELNGILSNAKDKSEFTSVVGRLKTNGPNYENIKGPNDSLLLADYVTWNGANPEIVASRKSLAVGTDSTNRLPKKSTAKGSNSANCKGSNKKLIKGSMYSNIRCN